jgi:hypothetical protein
MRDKRLGGMEVGDLKSSLIVKPVNTERGGRGPGHPCAMR